MTDNELYDRGIRTVAAGFSAFALATSRAEVHRLAHVTVAVFPDGPERAVYNNAILRRELARGERAAALDAMEELYAHAGVGRFAAWVHENDRAMHEDLRRRGYTVDTTTRAMGMTLEDAQPRVGLELAPPDWREHLRLIGVPLDLLASFDPTTVDLLIARSDGESIATGFAYDHDGDCGIYNVTTLEHARRQGFGAALTSTLVRRAVERGCRTASLQSTPMAERMYASVGFRDLGRIVEYVPRLD